MSEITIEKNIYTINQILKSDTSSNFLVAICSSGEEKFILKKINSKKNIEFDILKNLSYKKSPHIPTIHAKNDSYISIKYYNNYEILKNIKDKLNIDDKLIIFLQLCNSLKLLHSNNYIHSDISNNNILYNTELKNSILIDYNSSFNKQDPPEIYRGTHPYSPPDQKFREKSDVYSLCTLGLMDLEIGKINDNFNLILKKGIDQNYNNRIDLNTLISSLLDNIYTNFKELPNLEENLKNTLYHLC